MANENISPAAMRQIIKEIKDLTTNPPEGIKMIPNEEDLSDFQAAIDGPAGTPYEGGQFRIKLKLGNDFPSAPPKGYFLTKIFHPNVSSKGEICVNTLKKDWKPDLGLKHVLLCLLIVPNPESALNEEAGKLLLERYDDYAKQARLYTSIHAKPAKATTETKAKEATATAATPSANPESPTKKRAVAATPATASVTAASKAADAKKKTEKKSLKRL